MEFLIRLFAEDVWPLIWVIALVELLLVIAMVGTGRGRLLIWIAALPVLAVALLGVEWLWVTDRERVDGIIDQIAEAVRHEDAESLVQHLAPRCRYGGMNRDGIQRTAASLFQTLEIDSLKLSSRKTQMFRLRKEATAEFLAVIRGKQSNVDFSPYPTRWVLTFNQDTNGRWQVAEIQQLPAFGDNHEPLAPPGRPGLP
jgi:hypothetical protein